MLSNVEAAYFTTDNSSSVVCQRCLQSFEEGTELYFMHDRKPDGRVNESVVAVVSTTSERQRLTSTP